MDGRRSDVVLNFDTTPIKRALGGAAGSRFAQTLAESLPDCAAGQTPVAPAGHLPRCIDSQGSVTAAASATIDEGRAACDLGDMPLTSLAPVIATSVWIVVFTVVAVWRVQREEF